jgi:Cys-rich repeat protein
MGNTRNTGNTLIALMILLGVALSACGDSDGAPSARQVCRAYIECVTFVAPEQLTTVAATYGQRGTCFSELSDQVCHEACSSGIASMRLLAPREPRCPQCMMDADCSNSSRRACERTSGTCVECTKDEHCAAACDTASNRCVECSNDDHCRGGCDVAQNRCVECTKDAHCSGACDTATNRCVECLTDAHCPGASPRCLGNKCWF